MKQFDTLKSKLSYFQENLDNIELNQKTLKKEEYDALIQELNEINQLITQTQALKTNTSISYRLQIQTFKGLAKQFQQTLKMLSPPLKPEKPLTSHDLFLQFKNALKKPDLSITEEDFFESTKEARKKARSYYEQAKTKISLGIDSQGPFVEIRKKTS